jgi:hypothetical protein
MPETVATWAGNVPKGLFTIEVGTTWFSVPFHKNYRGKRYEMAYYEHSRWSADNRAKTQREEGGKAFIITVSGKNKYTGKKEGTHHFVYIIKPSSEIKQKRFDASKKKWLKNRDDK